MSVSLLKTAKLLISGPNSWTKGVLKRTTSKGESYCALGAVVFSNSTIVGDACDTIDALASVLRHRFAQGALPTPTQGSGGDRIIPWEKLVAAGVGTENNRLVAQFNNSTSQKAVLELFDEAIAQAEKEEGIQAAVPVPEPVKREPKPEPVKVPERVLELV